MLEEIAVYGIPVWPIILGIVMTVGIWFVANYFINKRFPLVKFLILRGDVLWPAVFRRDGDNIIEGNIFALFMGRGETKEDIKQFKKVLSHHFGSYSGPTYIATEVAESLIPIDIYWSDEAGRPFIKPEEVISGQKIAVRKLESIRLSKAISQANINIFGHLAQHAPAIVITILLISTLLVFAVLQGQTMLEYMQTSKEITKIQAKTAEQLLQTVTGQVPANTTIINAGG